MPHTARWRCPGWGRELGTVVGPTLSVDAERDMSGQVVETLQAGREARVPRSEIANPSPKHDDRGAVCARWVRCGKPWCRCMSRGPKHGPYFARYWREGSRRRKEYVRLADVAARRGACDERRDIMRDVRELTAGSRQTWRTLLGALREYEKLCAS